MTTPFELLANRVAALRKANPSRNQPMYIVPPHPLTWTATTDSGLPALVAPTCSGQYKIIRVSSKVSWLFFEKTQRGFDIVAVGSDEELQARAAALHRAPSTDRWRLP